MVSRCLGCNDCSSSSSSSNGKYTLHRSSFKYISCYLFFLMISALLISGGVNATNYWPVTDAGYGNGSYDTTTSVELLLMDPQNGQVIQNCSLPNMPENRYEHTVDGNLVCGGIRSYGTATILDTCITLSGGEWKETHKLTTKRHGHSSWKVCEGVVLFGGGGGSRDTAELVEAKTGKTKKLFDLEYGFS